MFSLFNPLLPLIRPDPRLPQCASKNGITVTYRFFFMVNVTKTNIFRVCSRVVSRIFFFGCVTFLKVKNKTHIEYKNKINNIPVFVFSYIFYIFIRILYEFNNFIFKYYVHI